MHARRAFYDAQRFELLFLMRDAQAIRDGIGDQIPMYVDLVAKACGGATYARLKTQLIEAKAYIQRMAQIKSDSKRWERRNEAFAECAPHIAALQKYIELYETLSDEFIRARKEKEEVSLKEERKERRNFILGVIGVIAAFISIVIGIVALRQICSGAEKRHAPLDSCARIGCEHNTSLGVDGVACHRDIL